MSRRPGPVRTPAAARRTGHGRRSGSPACPTQPARLTRVVRVFGCSAPERRVRKARRPANWSRAAVASPAAPVHSARLWRALRVSGWSEARDSTPQREAARRAGRGRRPGRRRARSSKTAHRGGEGVGVLGADNAGRGSVGARRVRRGASAGLPTSPRQVTSSASAHRGRSGPRLLAATDGCASPPRPVGPLAAYFVRAAATLGRLARSWSTKATPRAAPARLALTVDGDRIHVLRRRRRLRHRPPLPVSGRRTPVAMDTPRAPTIAPSVRSRAVANSGRAPVGDRRIHRSGGTARPDEA